jgi:hypothetical protein
MPTHCFGNDHTRQRPRQLRPDLYDRVGDDGRHGHRAARPRRRHGDREASARLRAASRAQIEIRAIPAREWDQQVLAVEASGGYSQGEWVVISGGRSFLIDLTDPARAEVEAASALADDVMDELNRPWPELVTGGVLETQVDELGVAVWSHPSGIACPVGYLQQALGSAGLIIAAR